jgi:chromosome partitioning protein
MKKIICVANQKGGVGKTTTTVNLGACLALADQDILIIDLDPQGNATTGLGVNKSDYDDVESNLYTAIIEGRIENSMICDTAVDRLKIIPSSTDLYGAEVELVTLENREKKLVDLLDQVVNDFDFVLIDCPPSLGMLTLNALTAADTVLVPIQTEFYALEGLSQLSKTVDMVQDNLNPGLVIGGILFTMVDGRTTLSKQVINEVKQYFPEVVFETTIPRNVRLSEAPSHGQPIILYDIRSKGADAYVDLANEIIARFKKETSDMERVRVQGTESVQMAGEQADQL